MSGLKLISGKDCIKILCNKFGFKEVRQKGSHVVLRKEISDRKIVTVVPKHPELKLPTLKSALKLAEVEIEDFSKYL